MSIRLYTLKKGLSESLLCFLIKHGHQFYEWVDDPALADFFVFPANYEVGHELTDHYLDYYKGNPADRLLALQYEQEIKQLADRFNKKILVFFLSDAADPVNIENAIVFRTSLLKSKRPLHEYAMPAFKHSFWNVDPGYPEFQPWQQAPSIAFRGQATMKMKRKTVLKNRLNLLSNRLGADNLFSIKNNFGYLERRNAIHYLQQEKSVHCDFTITSEKDIYNDESNRAFRQNVFGHPYNLCASGFGNYSYRLYEVMSAGRIPVFINTDCYLPFEEFIDWKKYIVWVERNDIPFIGRKLKAFHQEMRGELFIQRQQQIKQLWKDYLSPESFFDKMRLYLQKS